MLGKLLLITAVALAAIHSTSAQDCLSWTNWFDLDDPDTGDGDTESLADIRAAMPGQVCEGPTVIDARIKDPWIRELHPNEVVLFNRLPFFTMTCLNADQDDLQCEDYEIRFCCPDVVPECPEGCSWTDWFDDDDPDDEVDFEHIHKVLENNGPDAVCLNPKALQARVIDTKVDSSLSGQSVTLSGDSRSFLCLDDFQAGGEKCHDYEIRFCCPDDPGEDAEPSPPDCPSWTNWFDLDDPNTGEGDIESILSIRAVMPEEVCEDPTLIDHRIKDPVKRLLNPGEIVVFNLPFTMLCLNADQPDGQCEDYEVRFCCPDVVPECADPCSWTNWFSHNTPAQGADIEDHSLIAHFYPGQVCQTPKVSQARVIATKVDSSLAGEIVIISPTQFFCQNRRQTDKLCEDYEIRFCCPDVVPECPEGCSWSDWFDEDDPDDGVDYESTLEVRENKGEDAVCRYPKVAQARVIATKVDSSLSGQAVAITPTKFSCLDRNQAGGEKCHDYEARFCCPDDPGEDEPPTNRTGYIPTEGPTTALVQITSPGEPRPNCPIDIVIVVDLSSSISIYEFLRILHFLIQFIQCFDGMDVRFGLITYECLPNLEVPLGEHSLDDLLDAIQELEPRGGRSRTGLALHYVKCMTDFREDACSVVVVVSDGTAPNGHGTDDYIAQAGMLRDSGIELYAVAVGYPLLVNTAGLATITGNPDRVVDPTDPCALADLIIEECC